MIFFSVVVAKRTKWSILIEMKKEILTSVYGRLRNRLISRARNVVGDDNDAKDILQDAFVRLWSSRIDIEHESHAEGLLNVTVRNLSIDRYHDLAKHCQAPIEGIPEPDNGDVDKDQREQVISEVNDIIDRYLSNRDREILLKRDRDEWTIEEIAEHFDLTPANVRMIVSRARSTVRNIYNLNY